MRKFRGEIREDALRGFCPLLYAAGKVATARAKIFGVDLPDVKISLDSLEIMQGAMKHFYIKGMIEKSAGEHADWKAVDAAMIQAASIARDVAGRYADRVVAFRIIGAAEAAGAFGVEDLPWGRPPALTYGRPRPASGAHARHAAQCRSPLFGAVVLTRIPAASALN